MSKPGTTPTQSISRDSGIYCEDCDRNKSSSSSTPRAKNATKTHFSYNGECGSTLNSPTSKVHRIAQMFEKLTTCNDDGYDRSSPPKLSSFKRNVTPAYQSNRSFRLERDKVIPVVNEEQLLLPGIDEKCDSEDTYEVTFRRDQSLWVEKGNDYNSDELALQYKVNRSVKLNDPTELLQSLNNNDSFELTNDEKDILGHHAIITVDLDKQQDGVPSTQGQLPKTKAIDNITKELLEMEEKYVQTLEWGIRYYPSVMQHKLVPIELKGLLYHIFETIEEVLQLHKNSFLPTLRQNQASIQGIAESFIKFIEQDQFYCYILFALSRQESVKIFLKYTDFFKMIQNEDGDKLGLDSFLLEPIQRFPKYKLLLARINNNVFSSTSDDFLESVKNEVGVLCKAEKRVELFTNILNDAMHIVDIRDCCPINLNLQGMFRKMFELDIYDHKLRRLYPGKVFLFDKCIIYTEKVEASLEYRGLYMYSKVNMCEDANCNVYVYTKTNQRLKVEFSASEIGVVQNMVGYIRHITSSSVP